MRGVSLLGMQSATSDASPTTPPSAPVIATVNAPHSVRELEALRDVGASTGGGEADRHVAVAAERVELAGEDLVERAVVRDRGQECTVGGQGE